MNLLVLGASGGVGRHVVAQALEAGHQVTALVREGTPYDGPAGARVIRGEVLREGALAEVLPGHDAVLSSLGLKRRYVWNPWSAPISPPELTSRSAALLVAAMQAAGVSRVVAVSAAGVAESGPRMNAVMRGLVASSTIGVAYRDLAEMERVYREARGIDAVCLRPVTLTDGPLTRRVRVVDHFGATMTISRADVAFAMLEALSGAFVGCPQIAGA